LIMSITSMQLAIPRSPAGTPRWNNTLPDDIVEDILTDVWLRQDIGDRWQCYTSMLGVCRQWNSIMLILPFKFIVADNIEDCNVYRRMFLPFFPRTGIADPKEDEPYLSVFSRTHIRAPHEILDSLAFVPNCISIEIIIGNDAPGPRTELSYAWSRFPRLRSLSLLYLPNATEPRQSLCRRIPRVSPFISHLHLHYPEALAGPHASLKHLSAAYPNVTHLRLSAPIPLFNCIGLWKDLQVITIDAPPEKTYKEGHFQHCHISPFSCVVALKAGLFPPLSGHNDLDNLDGAGPMTQRKIVVNAGMSEPLGWTNVANMCREHGVELVHKVEHVRPWSKGSGHLIPKEILRRPSYTATTLHLYPDF